MRQLLAVQIRDIRASEIGERKTLLKRRSRGAALLGGLVGVCGVRDGEEEVACGCQGEEAAFPELGGFVSH